MRIGVHATEAVDLGDDYLGKGVDEAARVGAAAGTGEILVTAAALVSVADNYRVCNNRELDLKGLSVAIEVASVEWQ
jgi:adenylate cyclase